MPPFVQKSLIQTSVCCAWFYFTYWWYQVWGETSLGVKLLEWEWEFNHEPWIRLAPFTWISKIHQLPIKLLQAPLLAGNFSFLGVGTQVQWQLLQQFELALAGMGSTGLQGSSQSLEVVPAANCDRVWCAGSLLLVCNLLPLPNLWVQNYRGESITLG